jgi:hypothetical protein
MRPATARTAQCSALIDMRRVSSKRNVQKRSIADGEAGIDRQAVEEQALCQKARQRRHGSNGNLRTATAGTV